MADRQAHTTNAGSLARSKSLSGKQAQQQQQPGMTSTPTANGTSAQPVPPMRRSASQRGPSNPRRPSDAAAVRAGIPGLMSTSELYNAVPAPPPHLRNEPAPPSPLANGHSDGTNGGEPKLVRPQPVAFGAPAGAPGSALSTTATPATSFYGGGGFTALPEGSPLSSPFSSAPPSRRGSFVVSHPHASGPRPPVIRRRDSNASGSGYMGVSEYPPLAGGQVYVDVDTAATPSMLSRAGSPTLPLMTQKTASRSSSRRGSMADGAMGPGGRPVLGGGFGGFEMSMMSRVKKTEEFVGSIDCGTT